MSRYIMVSTTTDSVVSAKEIGQRLVESSLAACVQIIGPISSIYRWKEGIEEAQEWLCLIKTRDELLPQVEMTIAQRHTYETPEIVAWFLEKGSRDYFAWLDASLKNL
jgi:periplasmic divalent cation tolerance protein